MKRRPEPWIRGKALKTVIALDGIKPGDEVMLTRSHWKLAEINLTASIWCGRICTVDESDGYVGEFYGRTAHTIIVNTRNAWLTASVIVGWRPKRRS